MGIGRLLPPPWRSSFSRICPQRCIFETLFGFVGTLQFRALVLGRSPHSVGSCLGCAAAQTRILSVPCTPHPSSSAQGVHVILLWGLMPRTPHSHWSPPPWRSSFSRICPQRCIFETLFGFVGTLQFRALVLGRSPHSVGSCLGCAAAQTRILSVPCTPHPSSSAQGVHVILLWGLMPRTPHSHWSIDVYQSVLYFRFYVDLWNDGRQEICKESLDAARYPHYFVLHSCWDWRRVHSFVKIV